MSALLQRLLAPPVQVLRTLQPTSSTVSYTISTCSASNTIPAKIAVYTGLLIRILAGLSTALLLWIVARPSNSQIHDVLPYILGSHKTWQLFAFADTCQWTYLVPSAVVVFFLVFRRNYTEESLTVLRGLGVQTSTTSSTYLQTPTTRLIPTTSIQDIFIYEAFKGFEVRFYLAIVVEGEEDVLVVFPSLLPKRAILEEVWRGTRKCLWEEKEEGHDGSARSASKP